MERTTNRVEIEYSPGLRLLLVRPDDAEGPLPVIVWVHGGGWRSGDRHDSPDLHEYFARHGFAMVSIDYRLAPHSIFPAQLLDVRSALRWIRVNSLEHGLNPDSVGLWGASAGGHLAALAGLMASIPTLPEESATGGVSAAVHSVVTGYAPIDLTDRFPLAASRESVEAFLGGTPEEKPELARQASPIFHVNSAAPPFLIMQGTADEFVPSRHAEALFEAIAAANHEATLYLIDGFGHGFFEPSPDADNPADNPLPRLQAEPDSQASVRVKRHRHREEKVTDRKASFNTVLDFFVSTLKHNPAAQ